MLIRRRKFWQKLSALVFFTCVLLAFGLNCLALKEVKDASKSATSSSKVFSFSKNKKAAQTALMRGLVGQSKHKPVELDKSKSVKIGEQQNKIDADDLQQDKTKNEDIITKSNPDARVAVLCYHNFVNRGASDMKMQVDKFRRQMHMLQKLRLPVISMEDLIDWKLGKKRIPERSVVITIDDGWLEVYKHAFPVLKEYGYPFTIFLYKRFVNAGGKSLSFKQIKEMQRHGCTVGSHSLNHKTLRVNHKTRAKFLKDELLGSRLWLEKKFAAPVRSFAYPFGQFTDSVADLGKKYGYNALFTVNPAKITWQTPMHKMHRYIIHGRADGNRHFKNAIDFGVKEPEKQTQFVMSKEYLNEVPDAQDLPKSEKVTQKISSTKKAKEEKRVEAKKLDSLVRKYPRHAQRVNTTSLRIIADLSAWNELEKIDPASVKLSLAGKGELAAVYDQQSARVTYQSQNPLGIGKHDVKLAFRSKVRSKINGRIDGEFDTSNSLTNKKKLAKRAEDAASETSLIEPAKKLTIKANPNKVDENSVKKSINSSDKEKYQKHEIQWNFIIAKQKIASGK